MFANYFKNLHKSISSLFVLVFLLVGTSVLNAQVVPCIDGEADEWDDPQLQAEATFELRHDSFDVPNGDDIYTGSKDFKLFGPNNNDSAYNEWTVSSMQAKSDIMNAAAVIAVYYPDPDFSCPNSILNYQEGHIYLFFAGDRESNNGVGYIGFWFLLNGSAPDTVDGQNVFTPPHYTDYDPANYDPADESTWPENSKGDLLLLADFENGGREAVVTVLKWVGPGNGTHGNNLSLIQVTTDAQVAQNNDTQTAVPLSGADPFIVPAGQTVYDYNEFYEGAIDLTEIFSLNDLCNASWMLETRSSKEIEADLKDFVGASFDLAPTVMVSDDTVCEGETASLTATLYDSNNDPISDLGYVFTWSGPGSFTGQGTSTITFDSALPSESGDYSVTVTNNSNCVPDGPGTGTLLVYPETSTYSDNTTVCTGESASFNYDSDGDGIDETYGPYLAGSGTHTENVFDSNGCPYDLEFTVYAYPVTDTYMDSYTVCDGDTWTFSYDSDGDGNDESYGPYGAGVHTENVFDSNGCPYDLEFTVNEYPVTDTYMDSYTVCDGDTWTFSYDSDGDGNDESYGPYGAGVHTEDVTDINGCPYQLEFTVNEYPVTDTYHDWFTVCAGETFTFYYDSDYDGNDETYGPYGAGVHTEDVTDENGCPYQLEFTVNEYPVTDTHYDSYTVCDGDTWTFYYDSDGDGDDEGYGPYGAGVHTEDVTDINGCPYQLEFTVYEDPIPSCSATADEYLVCAGIGITLHVTGSGGLGADDQTTYAFEWSGADASYFDDIYSADPTFNAPVGIYNLTVTVTDIAGDTNCSSTCNVSVEVYDCVPECETAFGVATNEVEGLATVNDDISSCFRNDGFRRWGWVNTITEADQGTPVVLDLWAGAGQCDLSHGAYSGTATITYGEDGTVQVCYDMAPGYVLSEAHVYVGCNPYPTSPNGDPDDPSDYTVAPGQYSFNAGDLGYVQTSFCTPEISASGDFYVIVHAVVCETNICEGCYLPGSPNEGGEFDELSPNDPLPNCTVDTGGWGRMISFDAYPVPFKEEINIQYQFDYDTDVTIQILDLKGTLVREVVESNYIKGAIGKTTIDMSRTDDQMYFVRLTTREGTSVKKIVSSN